MTADNNAVDEAALAKVLKRLFLVIDEPDWYWRNKAAALLAAVDTSKVLEEAADVFRAAGDDTVWRGFEIYDLLDRRAAAVRQEGQQ